MAVLTVGESIVPKGKTLISTTLVTAGVSSFLISNIPQIYTDLVVVYKSIVYSAYTGPTSTSRVRFNSDATAGNYWWTTAAVYTTTTSLRENGNSATNTSLYNQNSLLAPFQGYGSEHGGWGKMTIYDYSSTSPKWFEIISRQGDNFATISQTVGRYNGTSVTSIEVAASVSFTFTSGTITLYGVV